MSAAHAARLAGDLARLLDETQTERLDFEGLSKLAPDRFAEHWQDILAFLQIVTRNWPAVLADEGCIDPADRRNRLIAAQIALWRDAPPDGPVIAAGSTGSVPATADLLACVAEMEAGAVVLPGLDRTLDPASVAALGPGHPQFGMARLLDRLGCAIDDVALWHETVEVGASSRTDIVNAALRPPATAAQNALPDDVDKAFDGVRRVDCAGLQQEATVIALTMRAALEIPGRTAALVTPDRRLARRVAAELRRWSVEIDDSGGAPLGETVPGVFLRLIGEAIAADAAPVPLLAALKHPLAAGGLDTAAFRDRVREMELHALRGPRPAPGFDGLSRALDAEAPDAVRRWIAAVGEWATKFSALMRRAQVPVADLIDAHIEFAEAMAASDAEPGAARLWAGEAGESAAALVNELRSAAESFPPIAGRDWPALLETLMAGVAVRPQFGRHPRLHIWGLLEARLQQTDLMILGGLNEGVWPPEPTIDPWMSRPMRQAFGLAPPERRIGLTAHDFVQGFAARDVVLTRSTRIDGSPTVAARWLTRLETLLSASEAGTAVLRRWETDQTTWLRWQADLDLRLPRVDTGPPAPLPPVAARPDRLSVTEIETLIRDPYAIYARRVLRLERLDPIDEAPGAADRGTIVHRAIDAFLADLPAELPVDALSRLIAAGEAAFAPVIDRPGVRAFWWPRFLQIAEWFVAQEAARAPLISARHTEASGTLVLRDRARPFTLRARADRIDRLSGGGYEIVDYKTGAVPSKKDVKAGLSPQLPLEAAMVREGAFAGIEPGPVSALSYWKLSGGDPPGKISDAADDPEALAADALAGLVRLLDHYEDEDTPYPACPDPETAPRFNDYDHLERLQEWASEGGGE